MRRPIKFIVLLFALLVVWGLELAADFHVSGVWCTHGQAMGYGGVAFIALVTYLFVFVHE